MTRTVFRLLLAAALASLGRAASNHARRCKNKLQIDIFPDYTIPTNRPLPLHASRKEQFFDIVRSGLLDRFQRNEISRVYDFVSYASGEGKLPPDCEAPSQEVIAEYLPGLLAQPWWDSDLFPWAAELEKQAGIIRDELLGVLEAEKAFKSDSSYSSTMGAGWTALRLQRLGSWLPENTHKFPRTVVVLQVLQIPIAMRGVMFARQLPHTGVGQHSDGRNFILTAHLGLQIPLEYEKCTMTVAGTSRPWREGRLLVLDTSFVHSTSNDTDEDRYVLIIDFWHPEVTVKEREAISFIYDARNKFEGGRVEEIDCSYVREMVQGRGRKGFWDTLLNR